MRTKLYVFFVNKRGNYQSFLIINLWIDITVIHSVVLVFGILKTLTCTMSEKALNKTKYFMQEQ